jgi:hypothetical protein
MGMASMSGGWRSGAWRGAGAALLALALVAPAGCDEKSEAGEKIAEAERALSALNAGGASSAAEAQRVATYDRVLAMLRPVATSGTTAEKSAAQTIIGQVDAGKGQVRAAEAARLERGALMQIGRAGDQIDLIVSHTALAESLAAYDPEPEHDALDAEMAGVEGALAKARQRQSSVQGQVASLTERAGSRREQAAALRQQENDLRQRALGLPAVERPEMVRQAVDAQRQADTLEAEVVMITAGLDQMARVLAEIGAEIQQSSTQRDLLTAAKGEVDARARATAEQAEAAREAAKKAAVRMRAAIQEVETLRQGPMAAAYAESVELHEAALSALRSAGAGPSGDESRIAAAVVTGVVHQALADLYRERARASEIYGDMLERAVGAAGGMPEGRDAGTILTGVDASIEEWYGKSEEAYAGAVESFEKVGGRGAVGERVERVIAAIKAEEETPVEGGTAPEGGAIEEGVDESVGGGEEGPG